MMLVQRFFFSIKKLLIGINVKKVWLERTPHVTSIFLLIKLLIAGRTQYDNITFACIFWLSICRTNAGKRITWHHNPTPITLWQRPNNLITLLINCQKSKQMSLLMHCCIILTQNHAVFWILIKNKSTYPVIHDTFQRFSSIKNYVNISKLHNCYIFIKIKAAKILWLWF